MTIFMEEVFVNARRLKIPKYHLGVLWGDIVDFCESYEKIGESDDNINKKLSKAIINSQNAKFEIKEPVEEEPVEEEPVEEEPVEEEPVEEKSVEEKSVQNWKIYQKNPELFDKFTFSIHYILGFYEESVAKGVISLVIGKKGYYFHEWTNYWNCGSLMYNKEEMTIEIAFLKSDIEKNDKFQIMKNFITSKVVWNLKKYNHIRRKI